MTLGSDTLKMLLQDLQRDWSQRGVELVQVATGWRFQSRPEMREYLDRLPPEASPVLSGDSRNPGHHCLSAARDAWRHRRHSGVTVNSLIIKQLEDRGWVEVIGHRNSRPSSTVCDHAAVLDDLGLASLDQLPVLDDPTSILICWTPWLRRVGDDVAEPCVGRCRRIHPGRLRRWVTIYLIWRWNNPAMTM